MRQFSIHLLVLTSTSSILANIQLSFNALAGNHALDIYMIIFSLVALTIASLNFWLAQLSLLARNLVPTCTPDAHNFMIASISSLLVIPHAQITGISIPLDFNNASTAGIAVVSFPSSFCVFSMLAAPKCPPAIDGSSSTIASGNLPLFSRNLSNTRTPFSLDNIGISATSGNSFVISGRSLGNHAHETIPSTQASHAACTCSL